MVRTGQQGIIEEVYRAFSAVTKPTEEQFDMKRIAIIVMVLSAVLFSCAAPRYAPHSSSVTRPASPWETNRWEEFKRQEVTTTTGRPHNLEQAFAQINTQNEMVTFFWNAQMYLMGDRVADGSMARTARGQAGSAFDPKRHGLIEATSRDRARFVVHAEVDMHMDRIPSRERLTLIRFRILYRIEDRTLGVIVAEDTHVSERISSRDRSGEFFFIRREWLRSQTSAPVLPREDSPQTDRSSIHEPIGTWYLGDFTANGGIGRSACATSILVTSISTGATEMDESFSLCLLHYRGSWIMGVYRGEGLGFKPSRNVGIGLIVNSKGSELSFFPVTFFPDGEEVELDQPESAVRHILREKDNLLATSSGGLRNDSSTLAGLSMLFDMPGENEMLSVSWDIEGFREMIQWITQN